VARLENYATVCLLLFRPWRNASGPPPQPYFMVTSSLTLAPRQLLSKIATSPLAADFANDALLNDDQSWAADSASAALAMETTTPPPCPLVLPSCMANRSAAMMLRALIFFVFDDGQSPPDSWDDVVHQDVIPADNLDAWLLTPSGCQQPTVQNSPVYLNIPFFSLN